MSDGKRSRLRHRWPHISQQVCFFNFTGNSIHKNQSFPLRCMLRVQACRVGTAAVSLAHVGSCSNTSAIRESCPVDCNSAPKDGPTCASDGNVYNSTCEMKLLTCGQGVVSGNLAHSIWFRISSICANDMERAKWKKKTRKFNFLLPHRSERIANIAKVHECAANLAGVSRVPHADRTVDCTRRPAKCVPQIVANTFSRCRYRFAWLRNGLAQLEIKLTIVRRTARKPNRKWFVEAMGTFTVPVVNWRCWIVGEYWLVGVDGRKVWFQWFEFTFRAQRKQIQSVSMDRCKLRMNRCKQLSSCKEKYAGLLSSRSDSYCGTDSKTYKSECDLAQATCL